jgi:hypothetical protein
LDGGDGDEREPHYVEDDSGGVESVPAAAQSAPLLVISVGFVPANTRRLIGMFPIRVIASIIA